MMRTLAWVAAASLLLAASAASAGPPYATDDPEPVAHRQWELYLASQHARDKEAWSGTAPHFEANSFRCGSRRRSALGRRTAAPEPGSISAIAIGIGGASAGRCSGESSDGWRSGWRSSTRPPGRVAERATHGSTSAPSSICRRRTTSCSRRGAAWTDRPYSKATWRGSSRSDQEGRQRATAVAGYSHARNRCQRHATRGPSRSKEVLVSLASLASDAANVVTGAPSTPAMTTSTRSRARVDGDDRMSTSSSRRL